MPHDLVHSRVGRPPAREHATAQSPLSFLRANSVEKWRFLRAAARPVCTDVDYMSDYAILARR